MRCEVVSPNCPTRQAYLKNPNKPFAMREYIEHASKCESLDCIDFYSRWLIVQGKHKKQGR